MIAHGEHIIWEMNGVVGDLDIFGAIWMIQFRGCSTFGGRDEQWW